jgi:hypothetical protein
MENDSDLLSPRRREMVLLAGGRSAGMDPRGLPTLRAIHRLSARGFPARSVAAPAAAEARNQTAAAAIGAEGPAASPLAIAGQAAFSRALS